MPIASLSTISTSHFRGGRGLTGAKSTDLVGRLNTLITKVNELITNHGIVDTLTVGTPGGDAAYYGTSDSWMQIDGTNPPTFSRIRMMDETTGAYSNIVLTGGVVTVV